MNNQQLKKILKQMWQIRLFEEKLQELYEQGRIHGTMHLCIGQEAVAVGTMAALHPDDLMISNHRNHGHSLAKGMSEKSMLAEILGKKEGANAGKGGSMHLCDLDVGALGANGIVGGGFPLAAGVALACQMQETNQVVVCFAGDGAINQGSFHETINLASIWQLPLIFIIENNRYAMSSDIEKMVNIEKLSDRATSYGIEGITIDGNDVTEVYENVSKKVNLARNGAGPFLIEALTYRQAGHSKSDKMLYRTKEECAHWTKDNDPISRLSEKLLAKGLTCKQELVNLKNKLAQNLTEILTSVEQMPEPDLQELKTNVYAGKVGDLID